MQKQNKEAHETEVNWVSSQESLKFTAVEPKKYKSEAIAFWNDAPLFQSSIDFQNHNDSLNKFRIEKIEIDAFGRKILKGPAQAVVISGTFSETAFQIGQRVTVLPCLCCLSNKKEYESCSYEDFIFDSSEQENISTALQNEKTLFYIDNSKNTIIIEDDSMSVTSFCSALQCINHPLLQQMVADFSLEFAHPNLALGILVHLLIQSSLVNKKTSFEFLASETKKLIKENLILLYSCNLTDREALNEILKYIKNVIKFISRGFKVERVEHKVYSNCYGLKGNIDCLDKDFVIEIKSGKGISLEHRSQVIMYTILLIEQQYKKNSDLYNQFLHNISRKEDINVAQTNPSESVKRYKPLLYYVKSGDFLDIALHHEELIGLLKLRNDIASNKQISECNCPDNSLCKIISVIKALPEAHFLKKQFLAIECESEREKAFFKGKKLLQKQETIVFMIAEYILPSDFIYIYSTNYKFISIGVVQSLEENKLTVLLRESIDLEHIVLLCFDNDANFLKMMRWALIHVAYGKFLKKNKLGKGVDSFMLPGQSYGLRLEEVKEVATEELSFTSLDIESGFNSDLSNEKENTENKIMKREQIDEVTVCAIENETNTGLQSKSQLYTSASLKSKFLGDLFSSDYEIESNSSGDNADKLSGNKIYESIKPKENGQVSQQKENGQVSQPKEICHTLTSSKKPKVLFNDLEDINESQKYEIKEQFQKSLENDFEIPEEFKAQFLKLNEEQRKALFFALNCKNYKIIHGMPGTGKSTVIALLINILIYYKQKVLLVCYTHLAIENILKKLNLIKYYKAKKENLSFNTSAELLTYLNDIELVVGTCYSFSDPIYLNRKFDYCIIDEGSQMHLLLALIPISLSERFCIVGDHLQLKPLSKKSKDLSLSLFEYLIEDCTTLTQQYRMGDEIMNLSNTLFYGNRLLGFNGKSSVVFIDADKHDVMHILMKERQSTVLCYFNSKVREILTLNPKIEVTTVDKFQGSESDEIIVLFDPIQKCEVLESRERLNVALTRARKRLTLIGSKKEMLEISLFRDLLDLINH
ncbi:DNA replication endonuclease-helicase Dna2 [Glugoides intestinalis]